MSLGMCLTSINNIWRVVYSNVLANQEGTEEAMAVRTCDISRLLICKKK